MRLEIDTTPESLYAIESSVDLENWNRLDTLNGASSPSSTTEYIHEDALVDGKKFWKVSRIQQ